MLTADTITDGMIREYVIGPGKGRVSDAEIILFSTTTSYEGKTRIREEFARLLNARSAK
jgi:hypothetical protein